LIEVRGGKIASPIILSDNHSKKSNLENYKPLEARLTLKGWAILSNIKNINWPFWICLFAFLSLLTNLYTCNSDKTSNNKTINPPANNLDLLNFNLNPRPLLDISETSFSIVSDNYVDTCNFFSNWRVVEDSIFDLVKIEKLDLGENELVDLNAKIGIVNVGNEIAKDIKIHWNFDYYSLREALEIAETKTSLKIDQNLILFSECEIQTAHSKETYHVQYFDRIFPLDPTLSETQIELPDYFVRVSTLFNQLMWRTKGCPAFIKSTKRCYFPTIEMIATYNDLKNNMKSDTFRIYLKTRGGEYNPYEKRGLEHLKIIEL